MAVTNYHTIDGEIIGETTEGSPRVDYLTDALGSVTATVNQSGSVVNTYRYTPFGSTLAKTGTGADPAFGWVGQQGYRPTGNKFSDFYVMFRHYDKTSGRWPTVDPFDSNGLELNCYLYADNRAVLFTDPTGLQVSQLRNCPWPKTGVADPAIVPSVCEGSGWIFFKCCLKVGLIVYLLCDPVPAGPKPRPDLSCETLHPGLPKSNAIYIQPRDIETFFGANCNDASSSAVAAIRRHFKYPRITLKPATATEGPCAGSGLHVVAVGNSGKLATIVCCPTCDDAPESLVAQLGCKCAILTPNKKFWIK